MDDAIGIIANSRGPESLTSVVDALGAGAPIHIGDLATGGPLQEAAGPRAGHDLVRMPAPWE